MERWILDARYALRRIVRRQNIPLQNQIGLLEKSRDGLSNSFGLNIFHSVYSPSASRRLSSIIISGTSIFIGHLSRQRPQVRQV